MAFSDPQSVKVGATTHSLPRVATGERKSEYANEDGSAILKIQTSSNGNRKRQVYRLDLSKYTTDVIDTTRNVPASMSTYLVVDRPMVGYTNTQAQEAVKGLLEALIASSEAAVKKLLAEES